MVYLDTCFPWKFVLSEDAAKQQLNASAETEVLTILCFYLYVYAAK